MEGKRRIVRVTSDYRAAGVWSVELGEVGTYAHGDHGAGKTRLLNAIRLALVGSVGDAGGYTSLADPGRFAADASPDGEALFAEVLFDDGSVARWSWARGKEAEHLLPDWLQGVPLAAVLPVAGIRDGLFGRGAEQAQRWLLGIPGGPRATLADLLAELPRPRQRGLLIVLQGLELINSVPEELPEPGEIWAEPLGTELDQDLLPHLEALGKASKEAATRLKGEVKAHGAAFAGHQEALVGLGLSGTAEGVAERTRQVQAAEQAVAERAQASARAAEAAAPPPPEGLEKILALGDQIRALEILEGRAKLWHGRVQEATTAQEEAAEAVEAAELALAEARARPRTSPRVPGPTVAETRAATEEAERRLAARIASGERTTAALGLAQWAERRELAECPLCGEGLGEDHPGWGQRRATLDGIAAQVAAQTDRARLEQRRCAEAVAEAEERHRAAARAAQATDPRVRQAEEGLAAARVALEQAGETLAKAQEAHRRCVEAISWVTAYYGEGQQLAQAAAEQERDRMRAEVDLQAAREALGAAQQAHGRRQSLKEAAARARDAQVTAQDQLDQVAALGTGLAQAITELVQGRLGELERRVSSYLPAGWRFGLELGKGRAGVRFGLRQPDGRLRGHTALYGAQLLCLELALALALAPPGPLAVFLLQDGQERALQGALLATLLTEIRRVAQGQIVLTGLGEESCPAGWRSVALANVVVGPPRERAEAAVKAAGAALAEEGAAPPKRARRKAPTAAKAPGDLFNTKTDLDLE